jgi:hypothetical protein
VASFEELLAALDVVGEPCDFPLADWPDQAIIVRFSIGYGYTCDQFQYTLMTRHLNKRMF